MFFVIAYLTTNLHFARRMEKARIFARLVFGPATSKLAFLHNKNVAIKT